MEHYVVRGDVCCLIAPQGDYICKLAVKVWNTRPHLSLLAGSSSAGSQTPPSGTLTGECCKMTGHILDCKVTMCLMLPLIEYKNKVVRTLVSFHELHLTLFGNGNKKGMDRMS